MKTITTILAACAALLASAALAAPAEEPVAVRTDHLPSHVARRVEQEAAKGPAALRRYVTITRNILAIDLDALLVPADAHPARAAKGEPVPRKLASEAARKTP